jgi:hypothetical protein
MRQADPPVGTGPRALPKTAPVPDRPSRDRPERPGDERELVREQVQREFRSADHDGDGYLSRSEIAGRFPLIEREFERVDADGDGRISPQEFMRLRRFQARQQFQK